MTSRTMESSSASVAPSQHANLQMRQVMEIVPRSSADWEETKLTCSAKGEALSDCVASKLGAGRIVLFRSDQGSMKYVLGPVIVSGTDVETATAQLEQQPDLGWSILIELTPEAGEAFQVATEAAASSLSPQNEIATVIDGRIVSSPVVLEPITGGRVVLIGRFTEMEANALASSLVGTG
jgi:preprotein translocase subunit SecD